jgi:L-threonylcarbamoyladenylate synthase
MITRVIWDEVLVVGSAEVSDAKVSGANAPEALPSPGMGMRHYAPRARLVLVTGQREMLNEIAKHSGAEVGVMLPDEWNGGAAEMVFRWGPWGDAEILARLLYLGLRNLDERGAKVIVCPVPRMGGLGEALRDRLQKAARTK